MVNERTLAMLAAVLTGGVSTACSGNTESAQGEDGMAGQAGTAEAVPAGDAGAHAGGQAPAGSQAGDAPTSTGEAGDGGTVAGRSGQLSAVLPDVLFSLTNQNVNLVVPLFIVLPNGRCKIGAPGNDQRVVVNPGKRSGNTNFIWQRRQFGPLQRMCDRFIRRRGDANYCYEHEGQKSSCFSTSPSGRGRTW